MPGERFGPYELVGLIGRGGMGEVHRAIDTRKNRGEVALKRLPAGLAADPDFQRRFLREAELAARLRDPHVIPIHDYGEIDGQPYLDMRLVDGTDLASHLARNGPLDPSRAVDLVAQVAGALDAAHAEGLVHRDVKPHNILLAGGGGPDFAYLIDFGIAANLLTNSRSSSMVSGTAAYMAPERFGAGGDHRVDVYALGCVLHELLTGRTPFTGDFLQLLQAHVHEPPPRPSSLRPDLPRGLDDVVTTAMAKDPDRRHATAGALAAAARGAPERPATPRPAPSPPRARESRAKTRSAAAPPVRLRSVPPLPPLRSRPPRRSWYRRPGTVGGLVALGALALVGIVIAVVGGGGVGEASVTSLARAGTHLALGPDARTGLLVTNGLDSRAGVMDIDVDATDPQQGIPVDVPGNLTDVALSPDGRRGYVTRAQPGADALVVIDRATQAVAASVPVRSPSDVEVAPDGAQVYVVDGFGAGAVSVVDAASNTVTATVDDLPGAMAMALSPDGRRAYVATSSGLAVIDTATNTVSARYPAAAGTGAFGVRVAPDGRHVYSAVDGGSGNPSLLVVDTATFGVATVPLRNGTVSGVGVTPDGARVVVATTSFSLRDDETNLVSTVDTASTTVSRQGTVTYPWPSHITVTPDGRNAYFFPSEHLSTVEV
ncbi:hypothetical protein GCM10023200_54740 [Actinomycetospora chlora]|uniref:non-specific serine/threonine protein kinase n=1 Tax=Actinomycetospora chlora TaxID=663608 RepID=A0ABP9CG34_9PSEU